MSGTEKNEKDYAKNITDQEFGQWKCPACAGRMEKHENTCMLASKSMKDLRDLFPIKPPMDWRLSQDMMTMEVITTMSEARTVHHTLETGHNDLHDKGGEVKYEKDTPLCTGKGAKEYLKLVIKEARLK